MLSMTLYLLSIYSQYTISVAITISIDIGYLNIIKSVFYGENVLYWNTSYYSFSCVEYQP